jgi:hypothetical protein
LGGTNGICDYNSGQFEYLALADDTCKASKQKLWLSDVGDRWLASTAQAASEFMAKMFVNVSDAGYSGIRVLSWSRFPQIPASQASAKQ